MTKQQSREENKNVSFVPICTKFFFFFTLVHFKQYRLLEHFKSSRTSWLHINTFVPKLQVNPPTKGTTGLHLSFPLHAHLKNVIEIRENVVNVLDVTKTLFPYLTILGEERDVESLFHFTTLLFVV